MGDASPAGVNGGARTLGWARLTCAMAVLSFVLTAGLCAAAILMHAPPAAVPLIAAVCVACPVFGTWELPRAYERLRAGRHGGRAEALARLRQRLDELPETEHPLGY